MVLKFRDVLKETELLGPDDLQAYQQSLLTPLLLHARENVPFYQDRLNALFDGDEIDFSRWDKIPLLTRTEAQQHGKSLKAVMVPPHLGVTRKSETSGSMGRPLRFSINELVDVSSLAMTDRLYRWWRLDGSKLMAIFVPPRMKITNPEQTITHGWRSGFLEGLNYQRSTQGDIDSHIDWLCDVRPDYLVSYPSMIRAIAERTAERGINLTFDRVISRCWVVDKDVWPLCRKVFKAPLIDQYGANEIGQVACQCPHCDDYHVNSEVALVEVLDEKGAPVAPGEAGRVVLTSFYNYAMPFIRYEIGDFAQLAPTGWDCSITLPRLSRIMGRYRNAFPLGDGRTIYPNPSMSKFRDFFSYKQIQVVQTRYDLLEVRYVPGDGDEHVDLPGLERWLQDELDPEFCVQLMQVDDIPALASGKYEEFVSMVEPVRP